MYFAIGERPPYWLKRELFMERAVVWKGSILAYGLATILLGIWCTDWKVVCERIPFYGSKFERGVPRFYSIEPTRT
ncbi:uncharacterized protein LOC112493991 [Cephus cinctus]|uniref:Uncharacterized protein LOC112493991 n=1 Tax=Cephus cinctus TaxID=211228 RepID=A0AAJ7RCD0_CEPCN|nr:uncharacterized protein LOC112493991 [Cephus cinctus]